jgi:alpha-tubulin suppressor-like RCC1 family protein
MLKPVVGLDEKVHTLAAGSGHICAVTDLGGVYCWGWNLMGQLGDGTQTQRNVPTPVVGLANGVRDLAANRWHTCALSGAGGVKCWGDNSLGQLGDGTQTNRMAPVDVIGLTSGANAVAAGGTHTCAITATGGVKCWGFNLYGQLGDGTRDSRAAPVDVVGLADGVRAIAAGDDHTCALLSSGTVKCWGDNRFFQLGDDAHVLESSVPVDVRGLKEVRTLASVFLHTCALTEEVGVWCWGVNGEGRLGDGTDAVGRASPVPVVGLAGEMRTIAVGDSQSCAISTVGEVKCWGAVAPQQHGGMPGSNAVTVRFDRYGHYLPLLVR